MESMSRLPKPKDLRHHLSREVMNRPPSAIKDFYKYFFIPGIAQFAGGLPAADYFPFDSLEANVALPARWKPSPSDPVRPPPKSNSVPSSKIRIPRESGEKDLLQKIDVNTALQYGTAEGYPPLHSFVLQFTRQHLHPNVPYRGGPDIALTVGSTDGFAKVFTALSNEWSPKDPISAREGLLVAEYVYPPPVQIARPRGLNVVPVCMDAQGILPDGPGGLQDVLENWDFSKGQRPHLLYVIPTGQNPTGGVMSLARRRQIYKICQTYDIVIIEDDPYYHLQYPSATPEEHDPSNEPSPPASSGYKFLDSLVPSFLSIDPDGRVIRLDTFSKTIAPGCRLGWITAQPVLIERLLRIIETSSQQPSGFVQAMVAQLILGPQKADDTSTSSASRDSSKGWDVTGWVRWLEGVRGEYERRVNTMCTVLDNGKHRVHDDDDHMLVSADADADASAGTDTDDWVLFSTTKMYDFHWPMGGMFLWLTALFASHPLSEQIPHPTLARALFVFATTKPYLVLIAPGNMFGVDEKKAAEDGFRHYRLCFAACPADELQETTQRLVNAFTDFWAITDPEEIEDILGQEPEVPERPGGLGLGMLHGVY